MPEPIEEALLVEENIRELARLEDSPLTQESIVSVLSPLPVDPMVLDGSGNGGLQPFHFGMPGLALTAWGNASDPLPMVHPQTFFSSMVQVEKSFWGGSEHVLLSLQVGG